MGIKSCPDENTCWHFDDKIGHKYLLEAIDAPLAPSYVFYNRIDELDRENDFSECIQITWRCRLYKCSFDYKIESSKETNK